MFVVVVGTITRSRQFCECAYFQYNDFAFSVMASDGIYGRRRHHWAYFEQQITGAAGFWKDHLDSKNQRSIYAASTAGTHPAINLPIDIQFSRNDDAFPRDDREPHLPPIAKPAGGQRGRPHSRRKTHPSTDYFRESSNQASSGARSLLNQSNQRSDCYLPSSDAILRARPSKKPADIANTTAIATHCRWQELLTGCATAS
jgi:hypothetical protein